MKQNGKTVEVFVQNSDVKAAEEAWCRSDKEVFA
jgi:hypothetical protein